MSQPVSQYRFSQQHSFSHSQIEDVAAKVSNEHRGKRLLISVTAAHRNLAMRQTFSTQLAFVLTLLSLYVTERLSPTIERHLLDCWLIAGLANLTLRLYLYYKIFSAPPAQVAKSLALRLVPLVLALIAGLFWIWSVFLFVRGQPSLTCLVLLIGFISLSVAVMGIWPTSPTTTALYLAILWVP
jgi:hypothetical protein